MTDDIAVITIVVLLIMYAMVDVGFTWREMKMEKKTADLRKAAETVVRAM